MVEVEEGKDIFSSSCIFLLDHHHQIPTMDSHQILPEEAFWFSSSSLRSRTQQMLLQSIDHGEIDREGSNSRSRINVGVLVASKLIRSSITMSEIYDIPRFSMHGAKTLSFNSVLDF